MPEPVLVYLVRHGLVENPQGVLYGRLPGFFLSAEGREQAARTGRRLARAPLAAIFSSPMERARETAAALVRSHPGLTVKVDDRLHEVRWERQGMPGVEFRQFRTRCYDPDMRRPGDETIEEIADRMRACLADLGGRHPGGQVAAVSHGDPIAVARAVAARRPLTVADFELDYPAPASVTPILAWPDGTLALGALPAGAGAADGGRA